MSTAEIPTPMRQGRTPWMFAAGLAFGVVASLGVAAVENIRDREDRAH